MRQKTPRNHFIKRVQKYNQSSNWVNDRMLIRKICDSAEAGPDACVLDIGIGTGKIAEVFYRRVKYVVGVDICIEMVRQAKNCADGIIVSAAEQLPFKNNTFDVCVCRQGFQFMELDDVLAQAYRVLKPQGSVVFCHLTAYDARDKDTTFFIQGLRNPARKNFFLAEDFLNMLGENNFVNVEPFEYITRESVNQWIDNGAINKKQMEKIRVVYKESSEEFKRIHNIEFKNGDIYDSMKMTIVRAKKRIPVNEVKT